MKKTKNRISPRRSGATDEEVLRWTTARDVVDRLDAGVSEVVTDHSDMEQVLREAIFQDNTAQLTMRLPPAMKVFSARSPANAPRTPPLSLASGSPNGLKRS